MSLLNNKKNKQAKVAVPEIRKVICDLFVSLNTTHCFYIINLLTCKIYKNKLK